MCVMTTTSQGDNFLGLTMMILGGTCQLKTEPHPSELSCAKPMSCLSVIHPALTRQILNEQKTLVPTRRPSECIPSLTERTKTQTLQRRTPTRRTQAERHSLALKTLLSKSNQARKEPSPDGRMSSRRWKSRDERNQRQTRTHPNETFPTKTMTNLTDLQT